MTYDTTDLLIVGSGLMGAAVAQLIREQSPTVSIVIADAGPPIGNTANQHLHENTDPDIRARYLTKVSSGIQALYTGVEPSPRVHGDTSTMEPGMYHLSALGSESEEMPAAAVAWNSGGMGIHWTAACPVPWGSEVPVYADPVQWSNDLATARRILRVTEDAFGVTVGGKVVLRELEDEFGSRCADGRHPTTMPMAIDPNSPMRSRTGPSSIFAPLGGAQDGRFTFLGGWQCRRVIHKDGATSGGLFREVRTGREIEVSARIVVLCADVVRTPQLLHASDIRPEALGRHINEHAILSGRVFLDTNRLAIDEDRLPTPQAGEWAMGSYWLPHSGDAQPFHAQMMERRFYDEGGRPLAYSLGLGWYVPTDIQSENRFEFSDSQDDATGMPRVTVHFTYSDADKRRIADARRSQSAFGRRLGAFDPETDSILLPPGSSLHTTGSVRAGTDPADSVCDNDARVWGFDNLYLAGNGVVPTAVVGNSTLTATAFAAATARAISSKLSKASVPHRI